MQPVNVLELGSGCGIVGMALAHLWPNCNVMLTDVSDAEDLVLKNLRSLDLAAGSKVAFEGLDWVSPVLPEYCRNTRQDLIVVSDCTYNEDSIPALVRTMKLISQGSPEILILVALKRRHANEGVFFTRMEREGFCNVDSTKMLLPHVWSPADSSEHFAGSSKVVVEIYLFKKQLGDG